MLRRMRDQDDGASSSPGRAAVQSTGPINPGYRDENDDNAAQPGSAISTTLTLMRCAISTPTGTGLLSLPCGLSASPLCSVCPFRLSWSSNLSRVVGV